MAKPYVPYPGPIVTHAEAIAKGLKRYFPGSRCRRAGHLSERLTSSGNCLTCHQLADDAYAKAHPEKALARVKRYQEAHPEVGSAYRQANKERLDKQRKAWKQANPEMVRANVRKWFAANPGVVQRWRKANPEAYRAQTQTRKALMANAEGRHTADDLKALLKQQNSRCGYCRRSIKTTWTVDHIQPLSRGGTNWITNIQLLCPSCNYSKQDADPLEFARRLGRLV
jgi:5-methylcytosine-specific restriction endonuclease McrA